MAGRERRNASMVIAGWRRIKAAKVVIRFTIKLNRSMVHRAFRQDLARLRRMRIAVLGNQVFPAASKDHAEPHLRDFRFNLLWLRILYAPSHANTREVNILVNRSDMMRHQSCSTVKSWSRRYLDPSFHTWQD